MAYTLGNVEDALYDFVCNYEIEPILLEEEDSEHQIWLDGVFVRVPELGVDIYIGEYCYYDEESLIYYPDFAIYVFMDLGTRNVVYDEGYTSFGAAVNNFMHGEYDANILALLDCDIIF